jgi:DNA-binding GntR family transcriptional regulator
MKESNKRKPPITQSNMPLTDQALAYFRDAIQTRKLKPGEELDFSELAQKLGMSRTPIRESIGQLITEGLLEQLPGGTVGVTQLSDEEEISFYHVRDELEIAAARAAAVHISDLEIEMLKANLSLFDNARTEPEFLWQIDNQFHTVLYDACNNNYLSQTLKLLRIRTGLLRGRPFDNPARINAAYKEHLSIVKALVLHNPDLVVKAVAKHYSNSRKSRLLLI